MPEWPDRIQAVIDQQGWNEDTILSICREFIEKEGLNDRFAKLCEEKAENEDDADDEV
jgi:hypothetical protein